MVPPAQVHWHQEWTVVISISDTLNGIRRNTGSVLSRPTGPPRVTSLKLRLSLLE
jgi:hypothetical protein